MEERRKIHNPNRIMQMIEETDAPKDKAILMILLQISHDLSHNAAATEKLYDEFSNHKENFDTHVREGQTLLNQGKGIYSAMSWMIGFAATLVAAILTMGGYIISNHKAESEITALQVKTNTTRMTIIEEQIKLIRKDLDDLEKKFIK